MTAEPGETPGNGARESGKETGNVTENSPVNAASSQIYKYNLDETKTPGGMRVRFHVRVETGQRAEYWDQKQAEAIWEFVKWAREYKARQGR